MPAHLLTRSSLLHKFSPSVSRAFRPSRDQIFHDRCQKIFTKATAIDDEADAIGYGGESFYDIIGVVSMPCHPACIMHAYSKAFSIDYSLLVITE